MCGISGIYAFNEIGQIFSINLHAANEALTHRGPDVGRLFLEDKTGMGHRRLSIIDLSADANQPMTDESGRYTIVYNGEVYNFEVLRNELLNSGFSFTSDCDTEVVLKLYMKEGADCLNKLNGFFAFAIYDKEEDELFIARDRMGIKPLVYYLDEDKFMFASEVQSLLAFKIPKVLDYTSLYQYFQFSYIPAPYTAFQNVYKLMPGHYIKLKKRDFKVEQYYTVPFSQGCTYQNSLSYDDAKKQLLELLDDSVRMRLVSDVPLGAFLSGGVDSSTIVALAAKYTKHLNTFSIGYKDEPLFDETKYANLVAKKYDTNHTVFTLGNDDFYTHIFNLLDMYGEPFADASQIPMYILCQETKRKVTVALSGDGADEVFAGYNKYLGEFRARENGFLARSLKSALPILRRLPKNRNSFLGNRIRQYHRFAEGMERNPQERYWYLTSWRSEHETQQMFSDHILDAINSGNYAQRKGDILKKITGEDFNEVLYSDVNVLLPNDMLHKVDSMSMANSLEVRVPFLDHRIVNFAFGLPAHYKINGKMKKRILQDAVRYLLPKELYQRPKHGFDVPLAKGYKNELRGWISEMLDSDFIVEQGVFKPEYIKSLKQKVFDTSNFDQNQVWAILAFQHWWKKIEPKHNLVTE